MQKVKEARFFRQLDGIVVRKHDGLAYLIRVNGTATRLPAYDKLDLSRYGMEATPDMLLFHGVEIEA